MNISVRMLSGMASATELFHAQAKRVLAGNIVMANSGEPSIQFLDANGVARNVQLPLESANAGKILYIVNTAAGAFALTLQSNAGAALSPAVTVAQNAGAIMLCDGIAWRAVSVT
jgi:hypothetical protein